MNLLGSYIPSASLIHSLDPSFKLLSFFLFFASFIILSSSLTGFFVSLIVLVILFRTGQVPMRPVFHTIWKFRGFLAAIFLMNAFFQPSEKAYFSFLFITFSRYGVLMGIRMVSSVALLTSLSSLLTATTTPVSITRGLRTLFHPLSFLRIPVDEAASIVSMSLCLIPILARESEDIVLSARARGLDVEKRKLRERIRALIPVVIPLFVQSFRAGDEIAEAMEARGYDGASRERIAIHFGAKEILSLLISISILTASIMLKGVFS